MRKLIFIIPLLVFVLAFIGSQLVTAESASACCDCSGPGHYSSLAACQAVCGPDCVQFCGPCCWVCI